MNHYKKGLLKYLPEVFLPRFKPSIIEDIFKEDKTIGKVMGINLKDIDLYNEDDKEKYIHTVKKMAGGEFSRLYIEGISLEVLKEMQVSLGLDPLFGRETRVKNIGFILRQVYRHLKESLVNEELLIISRNKDLAQRVIKEFARDVKLITVLGCNDRDNEEIYENIYEETGLSLFFPSNIQKFMGNFRIIINLENDINIELDSIRKSTIIFNLGNNLIFDNEKRLSVINDFGFNLKDLKIKNNTWIDEKIGSLLYEVLMGNEKHKPKYIYSRKEFYLIGDFVDLYIKMKGRL